MSDPIRAALDKAAEFYIVDLRPEWRKSKSYPYITVWRPNDCGYAYALSWAGIYSKARVDSKPHYYANAKGTRRLMNFPVPRDVVESLSIPEPRSGLIDGNAGPVLPNTPSVRYALWRAAYRPKLAAIAKSDAITDPATLLALAERCEQAAGPDRVLDQDIAYALGWTFKKRGKEKRAWWRDRDGKKDVPPPFGAVYKEVAAALRARAAAHD